MLIISYCDLRYEKFMQALVRSVLRNTPYRITVDYLNCPLPDGDERRAYFSTYRSKQCLDYLVRGEDICYLDADSIVRGDISLLEQWCKDYDTGAVFTPEAGPVGSCNYWLTSTVILSAAKNGVRFAECCMEIQKTLPLDWFSAQLAYVKALEQCKDWVRVKDLGYEYSDKYMRNETLVWEAQGERKNDPIWLAEVDKYRV